MRTSLTLDNIPQHYGRIVDRLKTCQQPSNGKATADVMGSLPVHFLIASAERKEGRSTTALGLAIATAVAKPAQRVLLADLDHRNPSLDRMLGLRSKSRAAGIVDVIHRQQELAEVLQATRLENLQVAFHGQGHLNVPEDYQSEGMVAAMRAIRSRYDYAFYDSPPLHEYVDGRLLSQLIDRVLLVIRYDRSSQDRVLEAKQQISEAKLAGAVVNDFRNPVPAVLAQWF